MKHYYIMTVPYCGHSHRQHSHSSHHSYNSTSSFQVLNCWLLHLNHLTLQLILRPVPSETYPIPRPVPFQDLSHSQTCPIPRPTPFPSLPHSQNWLHFGRFHLQAEEQQKCGIIEHEANVGGRKGKWVIHACSQWSWEWASLINFNHVNVWNTD